MKFFKQKKAIAVLAVLIVAIASVGAYAFFTSTGSGTGSATVGTSATATIGGTSSDFLYPAGPGVDVTITVTNNGDGSQHVGNVSLADIDLVSGCDVSTSGGNPAFTMADVTLDTVLAPNGSVGDSVTVHGTLYMNDTGVSQDGCKNKPLTLNLVSAA